MHEGEAVTNQQNDEDLADFISECRELIDEVAKTLADKRGALSEDDIHALYRSLHTIKGSAQLFGFNQLSHLGQAMEGALEPIRENFIPMPEALPEHMIKATDVVSHLLDAIEQQAPLDGFDQAVEALVVECIAIMVVARGGGFVAALRGEPPCEPDVRGDQPTQAPPQLALVPPPSAVPVQPEPHEPQVEPVPQYEPGETSSKATESIRVQVSLLDHFMNLVGELVLTKNQVVDLARHEESPKLRELSRDIAHVTSELQFLAMKTRLQPVGNVLAKFHRVVREIARDLDKKVEFNLVGAQTELDRTLVEAIKDPITHIVRNALDHGIETPEERSAAGKTAPACLTIEAYYENGQVVVAIEDNGRGLNIEAIRAKVIEKELLAPLAAEQATDNEIISYIFEPGFSTSAAVSALSGRGVGMDVVKNNIEAIGGRVDVETQLGEKTVFKLRIPLTMAIVSVMVVTVAGRPFAIPGVNIQELLQVNLDTANSIEEVGGVPVYKLRGRLLPIIRMGQLLELTEAAPKLIDCVAVVNTGTAVFGLAVDSIEESLDIVVKPLHPAVKLLGHFSGAAVLGDGKIALTLDVAGLAAYAQIDGLTVESETAAPGIHLDAQRDFLIARMSPARRIAIPIEKIYRLERLSSSELRYVGGVASLNYLNRRIRVFDVRSDLGIERSASERVESEIVMCKKGGTCFGIAVDRIEDTYSTAEGFDSGWFDVPGVIGNLILDNEPVVVVEPESLRSVATHNSLAFLGQSSAASSGGHDTIRVLLVEDSQFFRNQVKKVLEEEGMSCTVAVDGVEAVSLLSSDACKKAPFHAIVSDIEMPRMDGLELARQLRQDSTWQKIPLIAMTTRFRAKDQQAGFAAGFNEYLEKLNAKVLVSTLKAYTSGERTHAS